MKIIKYEDKYRDDMIFMILEAKNALGRVPGLNEDLLDIKRNYLDAGDMFWLAINEQDRVIGSIGYNSIRDTDEVWLHRLLILSSPEGMSCVCKIQFEKTRYWKCFVRNGRKLYSKSRKESGKNSSGRRWL